MPNIFLSWVFPGVIKILHLCRLRSASAPNLTLDVLSKVFTYGNICVKN